MERVTQKQVKAFAKATNIRATWSAEWEEWAIRRIEDDKVTEYFTSDNADALAQCEYLATSRGK
jgi:hypothetical protein